MKRATKDSQKPVGNLTSGPSATNIVTRNKIHVNSWKPGRKLPLVLKRKANITGIGEAATALGVHRAHLHLVLTGRRKSEALMQRFTEWQRNRCACCGNGGAK